MMEPDDQGLGAEISTCLTPIDSTRWMNSAPKAPSRSRIRYRGVVSCGNASRICCPAQTAVGESVTLKWRILTPRVHQSLAQRMLLLRHRSFGLV